MKNTTTIDINGTIYTVAELTVGEIDAVVGSIDAGGPLHRSYNLLGYDLTPEFVAASSGIDAAAHAGLTVDELGQLVAKVEEVNARFLGRIRAKAADQQAADKPTPGKPSVTTSAP